MQMPEVPRGGQGVHQFTGEGVEICIHLRWIRGNPRVRVLRIRPGIEVRDDHGVFKEILNLSLIIDDVGPQPAQSQHKTQAQNEGQNAFQCSPGCLAPAEAGQGPAGEDCRSAS